MSVTWKLFRSGVLASKEQASEDRIRKAKLMIIEQVADVGGVDFILARTNILLLIC